HSLHLVGIVSKGAKKFALMQDPKNVGHVITLGDCVGNEKAKVTDIGNGYISFAIKQTGDITDTSNAKDTYSVPLYTDELTLEQMNTASRGKSTNIVDKGAPVVMPGQAAKPPTAPPSTPPPSGHE